MILQVFSYIPLIRVNTKTIRMLVLPSCHLSIVRRILWMHLQIKEHLYLIVDQRVMLIVIRNVNILGYQFELTISEIMCTDIWRWT